jgi:hypothetical protein
MKNLACTRLLKAAPIIGALAECKFATNEWRIAMKSLLIGVAVAAPLIVGSALPTYAADLPMKGVPTGAPAASTSGYRFELAGSPASLDGKSIVSVKLVHGGNPVTGAIIIQSRADMSPIGMAGMTAPIEPLGEQPPGTYRFEISNGAVWKKPDNWALSFSAKVQGVTQTATGSVTVKLTP